MKYIKLLFLIPHIILFWKNLSRQRDNIVGDMMPYYKFLYSNQFNINKNIDILKLFVRLMSRHDDYRYLFYWRCDINNNFIKWLYRPTSNLYMTHQSKMSVSPGGILFQHPFSTIVNAQKIGKGCVIRHNTTIGNTHELLDHVPIIGDNVNIGAGAIIIGKIQIGNNVTIGAGSVVVKSVPDNCIIAGNPAKIIKYKNEKEVNI